MEWRTKAIYASELHRQREQRDGRKTWCLYHNGISSYDERFASVLPNGSFEHIVKPNSIALDCFAPTSFLRDLSRKTSLNSGVAITLTDTRHPEERQEDDARRIVQIESNFYTVEWYPIVNKYLCEQERKGFDLITCAPIGGWIGSNEHNFTHIPPKEQIYWTTNELWKLLNDEGKLFVAYLTHEQNWLTCWVNFLSLQGIPANFGEKRQVLMLEKTYNTPSELPLL